MPWLDCFSARVRQSPIANRQSPPSAFTNPHSAFTIPRDRSIMRSPPITLQVVWVDDSPPPSWLAQPCRCLLAPSPVSVFTLQSSLFVPIRHSAIPSVPSSLCPFVPFFLNARMPRDAKKDTKRTHSQPTLQALPAAPGALPRGPGQPGPLRERQCPSSSTQSSIVRRQLAAGSAARGAGGSCRS